MAEFIPEAAEWVADLSPESIPAKVHRAAKAQICSDLGAAVWTLSHPLGDAVTAQLDSFGTAAEATYLPTGEQHPAIAAAYGHAALSMAMDFDDTILGGHTGHSSTAVAFAYGEKYEASGEEVLAAVIAANEVGARLASAAAVGPFRGQQTAYIHAVEAVVARAYLEDLEAATTADAIGLALGQPPWPLTAGFLGSDSKLFTAAEPIATGIRAVDAARAGMDGNDGVVSDFLEEYSTYPLPEFLTGLGDRWHTVALTVKAHPGCAYVSPVIRATLDCLDQRSQGSELSIESVDVYGSLFTVKVNELAGQYVEGTTSSLSSLNFSVPYNVAVALEDGEHTPRQLTPERVDSPATWALADRVTVHHDADLTVEALSSEIPVGTMLGRVGWRSIPYAAKTLGVADLVKNLDVFLRFVRRKPLPDSFDGAEKRMGARVQVTLADGTTLSADCSHPPGFAGQPLDDIESIAQQKLSDALEEHNFETALTDVLDTLETQESVSLEGYI
jgi:2-methylcitrate dehydratase PrpD